MNWEALGAIGETVAAVAVVVTLGYLAVQIRQNTKSMRAATFQGVTTNWLNWMSSNSRSDVFPVIYKGTTDPASLSDSEVIHYMLIARSLFRAYENDYYQFTQGTFDAEAWSGYRKTLRNEILCYPGFRAMWMADRANYNEAFVEFVNREIELSGGREAVEFIEYFRSQAASLLPPE